MRPTVLILSYSNLITDPRLYKQMLFLRKTYSVKVLGINDPEIEGVEYISCWSQKNKFSYKFRSVSPGLLTLIVRKLFPGLKFQFSDYRDFCFLLLKKSKWVQRQFENRYWEIPHIQKAYKILSKVDFDLIIANDYDMLPLALRVSNKKPVIYDAHEFAPKQSGSFAFKLYHSPFIDYILSSRLPLVNFMMTVSDTFVSNFKEKYNIDSLAVNNAPYFEANGPSPVRADRIRLIHHGGASPSRKLESMIDMMDHLDERFSLDLMLVNSDPEYLNVLKKRASKNLRIKFIDPVPMQSICHFINQYDIGVYLLSPQNYNQKYALPNKFFEFLQARLAIAIGPSPEMSKIVRRHKLGIISKKFTPKSIASALSALTAEDIIKFKNNADQAAHLFCAETNASKVQSLVERALRTRNSKISKSKELQKSM